MKPGLKDLLWMASGAVVFLLVTSIVLYLRRDEPDPAELVADRALRIELTDRMDVAMAAASEAAKGAVLGTTDEDAQAAAGDARAAGAVVDRTRDELDRLLQRGGTESERRLLADFAQAFSDFRRVDEELLDLAVRNTNVKAYALAYGPASDALRLMDEALSRVAAEGAGGAASSDATQLALRADVAALRIQVMLPPHIAEESDEVMDRMEAVMAGQDAEVQRNLEGLEVVPQLADSADLRTVQSSWARFRELREQILVLSRENTNVRALAIALDRKRKTTLACRDALAALRKALNEHPVPGVTYGQPERPR